MSVASRGMNGSISRSTRILPVEHSRIGHFILSSSPVPWLENWHLSLRDDTPDARHIGEAATLLRTSNKPVAFPTETVYGLGADATRSEAVRGIYDAKQRPSDNPLIVHVASLEQLRRLLRPGGDRRSYVSRTASFEDDAGQKHTDDWTDQSNTDPIPAIYHPLIHRFWPGPLTILLPNPPDSVLAPEVTAGLNTFGARLPNHPLALALIHLADVPLAAPSANASTKPSPTTAEHVQEDLDGRIDVILDGGPCSVGLESTVVDGLSDPPAILRPGGISIEQLRQCKGWENVVIGYKEGGPSSSSFSSEDDAFIPKAPGMKYRHYSPKAKVLLYQPGHAPPSHANMKRHMGPNKSVGIIRTKTWGPPPPPSSSSASPPPTPYHPIPDLDLTVWDFPLGPTTSAIARGIFSALRALDRRPVDVIFVEGIPTTTVHDDEEEEEEDLASGRGDGGGGGNHLAVAIMNRLTKAAG